MKIIAFILGLAMMAAGLGRAQEILYATPADAPYRNAWQVNRVTEGNAAAVAAQLNAWCYAGTNTCFGGATESINWSANLSFPQVGWENAVINFSPLSTGWKVGNNSVIKCKMDVEYREGASPCVTPNNITSMAYLITAQAGTGWESGIRFGYYSIADSPTRRGAAIDMGDMPMFKDYVLIRLPGGREVTVMQFAAAMDRLTK